MIIIITHAGCTAASVGSAFSHVCLRSKRKMARAITTKVGRHIVHGRTSTCTDPEVKRSNPNLKPRVMVLTFAMEMGWYVEQLECACRYHCTFCYLISIFSRGNKCNQNLYSPGVGLHVDTTAHFSRFYYYDHDYY